MNSGLAKKFSRVVISTALGLAGRGIFPYTWWPAYRNVLRLVRETGTTVLAKSATRWPRRGNFVAHNPLTWRYIRRLPGQGMLNAYGLTNAGVAAAAVEIRESLKLGYRVIPNFYPEFAKGTETAIGETVAGLRMYQQELGAAFWAVELNFSCPNAREAIAQNMAQGIACVRRLRREFPELALIAKISLVHPYEFAQELERLEVQGIHGVNTIPYGLVFPPDRFPPSPLADVGGGGVSGGPAWQAARDYNAGLRRAVKVFLIMGGGVSCAADVQHYLDLGADAVSMCTMVLRQPRVAAEVLMRHNR
ncbi:MAG: HisA/HisF-related TIM barrel protein [Desulfobacca sp.]|uniref:HisA/HisF-related TIM barrel protein n=1 Tax=Desulfobacca sp. TaxID=2067990 RepID=UPI00404ABE57